MRQVRHGYVPAWVSGPAEELNGGYQGGEAVAASGLRVEVNELPCLPGVFAYGLEIPMLDKHGGEVLLVLDLHAVENAAVGIDADEELFTGLVVA